MVGISLPSLIPEGGRKKGGATREEQSRDNSAALGQGPGSSSRKIQSNTFESFCRTHPPTHESQRDGAPEPVLGPLNTNWDE